MKNARVWREGRFAPGGVLCGGGKILAVGTAQPEDAREYDCGGRRLAPGFLDIHTHGGDGVDIMAADAQGLRKIARFFAKNGTTCFLASVMTDTPEHTLRAIGTVTRAMEEGTGGAAIGGIHLEGPFLSPEYKGAMAEDLLRKGDYPLFCEYQRAAGGRVRYITVAPEVEGVLEMIPKLAQDGVTVAMGHSGADYETAMEAVKRGVRASTHTMNAMAPFHQHRPGILGAALESDIVCEAICDGRHLHPAAVRLILKTKGYDRVAAVTDSIMAAGLPDGRYRLGVQDVTVRGGDATLTETGVRAGSTLTTGQALKNLVSFTGKPAEAVLPLLTETPAKLVGLYDRKGSVDEGKDADLVLLGEDLGIEETVIGGAIWKD